MQETGGHPLRLRVRAPVHEWEGRALALDSFTIDELSISCVCVCERERERGDVMVSHKPWHSDRGERRDQK